MRYFHAALLLFFSALLPAAFGQTLTVSGTKIVDSTGTPCASCTVSFAPVSNSGTPISYKLPSGGQALKNAVTATITNGAFTISLPDTSLTNPQNVCFAATVTDNTTGDPVLGPGYSCVQPSSTASWCNGAACNFDNFVPSTPALTVTTAGPQGVPGCIVSESGTCSNALATAPTATQTINQPTGTTLSVNSFNATHINADAYPGADIGAKIGAADVALGAKPGLIEINTPGTISTAYTLSANHALYINAAITINAAGALGNSSGVFCSPSGALTSSVSAAFTATSVSQVILRDCRITATSTVTANNMTLWSGMLLSTSGASAVTVANVHATNAGVAQITGGSNIKITSNILDSATNSTQYGVVLNGNVTNVAVIGNIASNVSDPFEWFNLDSDPDHGQNPPTTRAGFSNLGGVYLFEGNTCSNVGACVWGSVAHDVQVIGNYAYNCADVCFDAEGSMDVLFASNRGDTATNGVGATFFYADHVSFLGNYFTAAAPFRIKNSSVTPSNNEALIIKDNRIVYTGSGVGSAIAGDPIDNAVIEGNIITNGNISFTAINGIGTAFIRDNTFLFTQTSGATFNAISFTTLYHGSTLTITGNDVFSSVGQPSTSSCIAASAADFNGNASFVIAKNSCRGFPVDVTTATAGGNAGTAATFTVTDNFLGANNIVHTHPGAQQDYYTVGSNSYLNGSSWHYSVGGDTIADYGVTNAACLSTDGNGKLQAGCPAVVLTGSLTTTAATSDAVTITGMTASGHCSLTPTNSSAATNFATTYISGKATNAVTVTHTATAGMTYDLSCTPN